MERDQTTTNSAVLRGVLTEPVVFSHEYRGAFFYKTTIEADRRSEERDLIPVVFPGRTLKDKKVIKGSSVTLKGQFRSRNTPGEERMKLVLYFYVLEVEEEDAADDGIMAEPPGKYGDTDSNRVYLDGYICKAPIYRMTPLGREIADVLLAVNRAYGKSDYIPCICWGRNARFAGKLEVGEHVAVRGRIQSREYQKKLSDDTVINRIEYEVSVSKMECLE